MLRHVYLLRIKRKISIYLRGSSCFLEIDLYRGKTNYVIQLFTKSKGICNCFANPF